MNWMRNTPLRGSFTRKRRESTPAPELDLYACYTSFQRHWQQALDIIERTQVQKTAPGSDDVCEVITHLTQMMTLLLHELHLPAESPSSCLDFLLSENVLDKVHSWSSCRAGQFTNSLKLEQLKWFEMLVSSSKRELLVHEPVLRPLLKLLSSCGECSPVEVEKRLVILLNQLCVCLVQNEALLDLFFCHGIEEGGEAGFLVFSLLIPFVHREGSIGQQARDAMLLCMALSKENQEVGEYVAHRSNFCPILATGLSGLYSVLPRKLLVDTEGWHCFTAEDANSVPELANFLHSLEFCNAVVEMAHPAVQEQLLDYLYQGFLLPVVGPALHQDVVGMGFETLGSAVESSIVEETIAATAYLNLFLRTITEPALFHTFLRFIVCGEHEGVSILNILIQRINSGGRLCLVTLSLFETLLDLNCEDLMLELVFRHLLPCNHVMVSQRGRICDQDYSCRSAEKFLSLIPTCCLTTPPSPPTARWGVGGRHHQVGVDGGKQKHVRHASLSEFSEQNGEDVAQASYLRYLREARWRVEACRIACRGWTYKYDGKTPPSDLYWAESKVAIKPKVNNVDLERTDCAGDLDPSKAEESDSKGPQEYDMSGQDSHMAKEECETTESNVTEPNTSVAKSESNTDSESKLSRPDSNVVSGGDSSGYESFSMLQSRENSPEPDSPTDSCDDRAFWSSLNDDKESARKLPDRCGVPDIGPFLKALFQKLDGMPYHSLYANLHLTGIVSRLAAYPQPLLRSFLLNYSLVFQPSVRPLFQVLGSLKQRIDSYTSQLHHLEDLVRESRRFLQKRDTLLESVRTGAVFDPEVITVATPRPVRRGSTSDVGLPKVAVPKRGLPGVMMAALRRYSGRETTLLESVPDGSGYRYVKRGREAGEGGGVEEGEEAEAYIRTRHVVLCAAVMEEWMQELAALSQEHVVAPPVVDERQRHLIQ